VLYAALLTVLCAVIAGVLPAIKVTRGIEARLRQASAGGGGLKFGGVWTAVIVAQVAVTVAFPVTAFFMRRDAVQVAAADVGFAARHYLGARLELDRDGADAAGADTSRAAYVARVRTLARELERRLEADPAVAAVTFTSQLPGTDHPQRRIEVEGRPVSPPDSAYRDRVSSVSVAPDYFAALDAPILAGRAFATADASAGATGVVVNESFARQMLGGRNAVGHRIRFLEPEPTDEPSSETRPGPWLEIVGVVKDLGTTDGSDPRESGAGVYLPAAPGAVLPLEMAVRLRGQPDDFAPRLPAIAAAVTPALRVQQVLRLDRVHDVELGWIGFWFRVLLGVSALAMLLSLAGIYAVMAFAVSRRTHEIGIRVAMGADARRIVAAVFARPLAQVAMGVVAGTMVVGWLVYTIIGKLSAREVSLVAGYALLMLAVCMLACVVPTRRALRIEAMDALRMDV
jgi:putative ABC transport system permease protein